MRKENYTHQQNITSDTPGVGYAAEEHISSFTQRIAQYTQKYHGSTPTIGNVSLVTFHQARGENRVSRESDLIKA